MAYNTDMLLGTIRLARIRIDKVSTAGTSAQQAAFTGKK
jgi:hypothetical protein